MDLRERTEFETEVISLRYDESSRTWAVTTSNKAGQRVTRSFNAVIAAVGHLNRPKIPELPGKTEFEGETFHSAEWPEGTDLRGKRVAVIGTGASAFQIVPSIVNEVSRLHVFQRTPSWMMPAPNYHDDTAKGMIWLVERIPDYGLWYRTWQFWTSTEGRLRHAEVDPTWEHPLSVSELNESWRRGLMENLKRQVQDRPDLLKKLTPGYPPGVRRVTRDNGVWIEALKQPHVSLITDGISHLERDAIVAQDGTRYEADTIVYATGFQATQFLEPIEILGEGGRNLHNEWGGDPRAYLGTVVPGFPNLFVVLGPNAILSTSANIINSTEICAEYAVNAIVYVLKHGFRALNCRRNVFEAYNRRLDEGNSQRVYGMPSAVSWFKGKSGRSSITWPFSLVEFWREVREFNPSDFEFRS
jgi:4-hydroxyacetophenone monooxygenase